MGATTEIIALAVDLFSKEKKVHLNNIVAIDSWNSAKPYSLRSHLMLLKPTGVPPFKGISEFRIGKETELQKRFGQDVVKDLYGFWSSDIGEAIENLGIGRKIEFKDLKPGDLLTFSRNVADGPAYYKNREKNQVPSSHNVMFLGFLDRDQKTFYTYDETRVVGFHYFSSQTNHSPKNREHLPAEDPKNEPNPLKVVTGLGERWAYFTGFCPRTPGYEQPKKPTKLCPDQIDPKQDTLQLGGQKSDCCVIKKNKFRPHGARLATPLDWGDISGRLAARKSVWEGLVARAKSAQKQRGFSGNAPTRFSNPPSDGDDLKGLMNPAFDDAR